MVNKMSVTDIDKYLIRRLGRKLSAEEEYIVRFAYNQGQAKGKGLVIAKIVNLLESDSPGEVD